MTKEHIEALYKDVVNTWLVFKKLLDNYEPTEEFMNGAAGWLVPKNEEKGNFKTDLAYAALSELYREFYKEDPMNEFVMLLKQAYRVEDVHGVKVKILIETADGTVREMGAAG